MQFGSIKYLNSTVEPDVAVDPTNPAHLVGAWQQDRWSDGGAHGLVAAYSTDGGSTWTTSPLPFSVCHQASGFSGDYLNCREGGAEMHTRQIGPLNGDIKSPAGARAHRSALARGVATIGTAVAEIRPTSMEHGTLGFVSLFQRERQASQDPPASHTEQERAHK